MNDEPSLWKCGKLFNVYITKPWNGSGTTQWYLPTFQLISALSLSEHNRLSLFAVQKKNEREHIRLSF